VTPKEEAQAVLVHAANSVMGLEAQFAAGQIAATLAVAEATERLAVAQEVANDLKFSTNIQNLPDRVIANIDPKIIDRAAAAGQRAMKAMGL
jgi:hypothetical protein